MIKQTAASFIREEDGHVDYEPMVAMMNGVLALCAAKWIIRLFGKDPEMCFVPACIAAVCAVVVSFVWFFMKPESAETEFAVLTVLSFAALAGYGVFRLAERIWKIREAGIVPGCIAAACVAVPGFRRLLREIREDRMRDGNEEEPGGGETDSTEHGGRP